MKKIIHIIIVVLVTGYFTGIAWSQCTPGDENTCPDPENNGQICPDSLPGAIAGRLYSESFTILAPPKYPINETDSIPLHHITLIDVANLPPGLTWQSNETSNEFMVGTYYCVLLEGTPPAAGRYDLKITVDVYYPPIPPNPNPILLARVIDSTSLFLDVKWDPNSLEDKTNTRFTLLEPQPNPFSQKTQIGFRTKESGMVTLAVFNLVGQRCYHEEIIIRPGHNTFRFNGSELDTGIYVLMVTTHHSTITRRLIKTE